MKTFLMTAFGKDRPGIVADVTEVIYETGCNLEDTSMTRLADEFTLVLLFTGKGDDLEARLNKECRRLEIEKNLSAFVRQVEIKDVPVVNADRLQSIKVEGLDQSGIVYKISKFLAENSINIEKLVSRRIPSAESGAALYRMALEVLTPNGEPIRDYEEGLEDIANDLHVDITF